MAKYVIVFLTKLARVDLVEELHEDEGLEDDRVHQHLGGSFERLNGTIVNESNEVFSAPFCGLSFSVIEIVALLEINVEHAATTEKKHEKDNDLEDRLSNDVSPHDTVDNSVRFQGGLTFEKIILRGLSG